MDLSESKSWPPLLPRLLSAMVFQNPPCVGFESQLCFCGLIVGRRGWLAFLELVLTIL
ncbi:uncharacterized protein PGTG_22087 [Puccinia graminis f. sp. tritici CRL 75-36-700-3]|uniref:Uncharacterized protein n=1 Tax=Puccinia graminis f. sp. tritici (strain CRL 75-36-700-3 / race SCCL) TaxID=418459 RepID=H6QTG2_PUCGT|nr:uncharacterized protein PGTG_22087 [Puccinia graminis f. sp. tritici CRL 75-36-700-3]EHS64177.1 hypothetical protein PGTG_22087 [Puccinia graminis f. sp. tritici CRL 75-36-700-3]